MKTIPSSDYKININNDFIDIARKEIYSFFRVSFFAKRKYDFKNLPILNYLDKSLFKYIINLEKEIDDSYGTRLSSQEHPDYDIQDDKDRYYNMLTQNIMKNLIKDKQNLLIINNIEHCDPQLAYNFFINKHYETSLLIKKLKTLNIEEPHIFNLLNVFDPDFKPYC